MATAANRTELKDRLILVAEEELCANGLLGLKARTITKKAGCALGAMYNAVPDMNMLVLYVNSRTLERLGHSLDNAISEHQHCSADEKLRVLAETYADFALNNRLLWIALFEHALPEDYPVPEWHEKSHSALCESLIRVMRELHPNLRRFTLALRARSILAAVHGLVYLSLRGRNFGVPTAALATEISQLIESMAKSTQVDPIN